MGQRASLLALAFAALVLSGCRAPEAPRQGYLTGADGAQLFYRALGTGPDTVVVVHGGPGAGMQTILPNLQPLSESVTLLFYDQRGGGRSALPEDTTKLDIRYFVEDLEQVRQHFGIQRLRLVAHSFGAVLVAQYLKTYPEHAERAAFIGATGPRRAPAASAAQAATLSREATQQAERQAEVLRSLLRGEAEDPLAACREYEALSKALAPPRDPPSRWEGTSCEMPAEAIRYYFRYTARLAPRSLGPWDFTSGLEHVTAALLVMHGDEDPALLEAQREWAAAVPNGRLLVIPGTGRAPIADKPELAFPVLEMFLRGDSTD